MLLLADVFCMASGLASMASNFKKERTKLDILTDIGTLLMVEKGRRGGIYHSIHWYAKANNKFMKRYDKK